MAHNITSPLSPCEGMIKDLSLDAIQLCERDGKGLSAFHRDVEIFAQKKKEIGALSPIVNIRAHTVGFVIGFGCMLYPYCVFERSRGQSLRRFLG